jgi:ATP-grasp domain
VNGKRILYLNLRSLSWERDAELGAALDGGFELVVATRSVSPVPSIPESDVIRLPTGTVESTVNAILRAPHIRYRRIDGVIAWTDPDVEVAALLGASLGLPGVSPDVAAAVRDKAVTRRCLDALGIANPRYFVVENEDQIDQAVWHVGPDCLIKPPSASGGRGIFRIRPGDDPRRVFREFLAYCVPDRDPVYQARGTHAVVEEYLTGSEHSVAGLVVAGQIHMFAITDKRVNADLPYQFQTSLCTDLPGEDQHRMMELAKSAVHQLGINNTGFHVDMMLTDAGPRILEVGSRLGGECINSHLIPLALGIRPYQLVLNIATGNIHDVIVPAVGSDARVAFHHLIPSRPGRIVKLQGFEALANHKNVVSCLQSKRVRDIAYSPKERYNSFAVGFVIIRAMRGENLAAVTDDVTSTLKIEVE